MPSMAKMAAGGFWPPGPRGGYRGGLYLWFKLNCQLPLLGVRLQEGERQQQHQQRQSQLPRIS